jgi:omega-amidase
MRITLVQTDLFWEDKDRNLEKLGEIIARCPSQTDLIILPEMFSTGFSMNPRDISEKRNSDTFNWMLEIALRYNFGICGSYIVNDDTGYFNRWIFVSPEKEVWTYDKRHLFSLSGEDMHFKSGANRIVFNYRDVSICPTICYDLRFPVWNRNQNDYDLLINSANWPESRRDVWVTLLKARAIENQCYVAGVNRIGIDGTGIKYCGDSIIFGPKGEIIASGVQNTECIISADISLHELNDFRQKFPVLKDRDDFEINP